MALFVTGVLAIVFFTAMSGDKEEDNPKPYALGPNNEMANRFQRRRGTSENYEFEANGYDSVGFADIPADYALGSYYPAGVSRPMTTPGSY